MQCQRWKVMESIKNIAILAGTHQHAFELAQKKKLKKDEWFFVAHQHTWKGIMPTEIWVLLSYDGIANANLHPAVAQSQIDALEYWQMKDPATPIKEFT